MEVKQSILIIDDDTSLRVGLTAILQRRGYVVAAAVDGLDGLEKVRTTKPDMILCDVMMPPPNGFEVRRILSQDAALSTIPFIFITARTAIDDRVSGIGEGADDYITKPFEPKELIARVEAVFRRVELEQAKGRAQMKVIAENEMETFRHEILQNFHHELRTPLTNILIPLETILNHKFENPEDQTRFIRIALANADRLESLTTDFILLTNIDHGDMNSIRQPIEVETHILAPIRRRMQRYLAKDIQLVTHVNILGNISAPRKEFSHAVVHILDNAFKFSPQGGKVDLSISASKAGDISLQVCDEGPGIPPEFAEKVFERFFQLSQGNSREYEGLGVGLTLAKAVMEKAGGRISILEAPKGCCIELYLPGQTAGDLAYG